MQHVTDFLIYFCTGLTSSTIPMYLAECSPSYLRGTLVSTNIAMVAFGQFMANVVDGIFGSDTRNGWRSVNVNTSPDQSTSQALSFTVIMVFPFRIILINVKLCTL